MILNGHFYLVVKQAIGILHKLLRKEKQYRIAWRGSKSIGEE